MSTEHDIYRSLRLNRIIVLSVIGAAVVVCLGAMYYNYKTNVYNMNHALVLSANGEVIPLQFVERKQVIGIQIREHLTKWFDTYYTFDQNNMLEQREKGLWLIADQEGQALERFYEEQGWFNDIIRKSLNQETSIIEESFEIGGIREPYQFRCTVQIRVHPMGRPQLTDTYQMSVTGMISLVAQDWPINPQGMIIHNYRESPWTKIQE